MSDTDRYKPQSLWYWTNKKLCVPSSTINKPKKKKEEEEEEEGQQKQQQQEANLLNCELAAVLHYSLRFDRTGRLRQ